MKKKTMTAIAVLLVLLFSLSTTSGADSAPGSEFDPLVSKSYVDMLFKDLEESFEDKVSEGGGSAVFQVVEVPAHTDVIGYEGTEMILRSGTAYAIDNGVDGISDLTAGADLKGGVQIQKNHHLLVPRSDGRGISCSGLCYVMIKGDYEFE